MIFDLKYLPLRNLYYKYVRANRYPLIRKNFLDAKIKLLKNIHAGETCFIIGNGPSMQIEDLERISELGFKSFAANSIYKVFSETKWRPTYYCAQDEELINALAGDFLGVIKDCQGMFVRRDVYQRLPEALRLHEKIYLPKLIMHIRKDKSFNFSSDASKFVSDGCTVTYLMLQMAFYMGFKKIYLIGLDHNFPLALDENENIILDESIQQHFFEKERKSCFNPARPYETTLAYKSARVFLENHNVEIYNATRGGKLEVFKRVSLDNVLKGE